MSVNWRAVTIVQTPFERGVALDRILQKPSPHRRVARLKCGRMTIGSHFRRDFLANRAKAAALVLFGTTGLSGVSAFATAQAICGHRFGGKVNPLHPGRAVRATPTGPARHFIAVLIRFGS
jgi:hypothetical protein